MLYVLVAGLIGFLGGGLTGALFVLDRVGVLTHS